VSSRVWRGAGAAGCEWVEFWAAIGRSDILINHCTQTENIELFE